MIRYKRFVTIFSPKSTRADKYVKVRPKLVDLARDNRASFTEIRLEDTPYDQARQLIANEIMDGDLVIAAGGDGTAQVTFDAVYQSQSDAAFMAVPIGNGNDISRALNHGHRSPGSIIYQPECNFCPLNIYVDGVRRYSLASYITFGATTVLVDYLNQESARKRRQVMRSLSPAASLPLLKLGDISNSISHLNFPDFTRDGKLMTDDSIGFFIISAAHNVLRLPKNITDASSEFFFHHAKTGDKNLAQKVLMAGAWSLRFPGRMTDIEELKFINGPVNLVANVAGDNVELGLVTKVGALRSERPVKVLLAR